MKPSPLAEALRIILKTREPVLVSACLAGAFCRYDGAGSLHPAVLKLMRHGRAVPVCPELLGGLPAPRTPCERQGGRVLTREGLDLTEEFLWGARLAADLARLTGCGAALLKARSPSCGSGRIYDGTFSGRLAPGDGILAEILREAHLPVASTDDLEAARAAARAGKA